MSPSSLSSKVVATATILATIVAGRDAGAQQAARAAADTLPARVVEQVFAALNRHDLEALMALHAPELQYDVIASDFTSVGRFTRDSVGQDWTDVLARFPGIRFTPVSTIAQGPVVVVPWTYVE